MPLQKTFEQLCEDAKTRIQEISCDELAHKLDMLNGDANGLPPLHADMRVSDWAEAMQQAFDDLNRQLDQNPDADTVIDPYAAENPAEFFAVQLLTFCSFVGMGRESPFKVLAAMMLGFALAGAVIFWLPL